LPISLSLWREEEGNEAPSWSVWAAWTSARSSTRNKAAQSGDKTRRRFDPFFIFSLALVRPFVTTQPRKKDPKFVEFNTKHVRED